MNYVSSTDGKHKSMAVPSLFSKVTYLYFLFILLSSWFAQLSRVSALRPSVPESTFALCGCDLALVVQVTFSETLDVLVSLSLMLFVLIKGAVFNTGIFNLMHWGMVHPRIWELSWID